MGETRVDLLHLLEDLRDAYPGSIEETILTEVTANSLDSGAGEISFRTDPGASTLTVVDDGAGMARRELARYHDVAASTKARGEGIGFAGVGIKLGLLLCEEVVTETSRAETHVATSWCLTSRHRAPWRWIPPPGLLPSAGTAVRLKLRNPLSPLLDAGFLEATLRDHFQPLLDASFDEILESCYARGVRFRVNGSLLPREGWVAPERTRIAIRLARKRRPSAVGHLTRSGGGLPEERRGVAVSTRGKVIKRGWDWLGMSPASPEQVGGLIEAPALAECLTLNKADFLRTGPRGLTYLAYRKAVQEAVSAQLAAWGDLREPADQARRRLARPMERDLETVLVDLAEAFPVLAALVERHSGGQRKLAVGATRGSLVAAPAAQGREPGNGGHAAPTAAPTGSEEPPPQESRLDAPGPAGRERRPARYGLQIEFESRPDDDGLSRLVESTVWVNEAHPAYGRAALSRSEGYHVAVAVALALAQHAVEPGQEPAFLNAFLARWGEALDAGRRRRR